MKCKVTLYNIDEHIVKRCTPMAKKQPQKRRPSKRQRRQKVLIYIMVIAMVLSMLTAGLGGIALL